MAQSSQNESTYLVLSSLESGQKYGLEIIESISQRTGGNYIMKKPTLYSALTRLEKKGFVSSTYWGDSELGGKRHYYALTNTGKTELEKLSSFFDGYDFSNQTESEPQESENETSTLPSSTENTQVEETEKPVILQQENLFNLTETTQKPQQIEAEEEGEKPLDNQIDFFSFNQIEASESEATAEEKPVENSFEELLKQKMEESKEDDSRFLSNDERVESQPLTYEEEQQNKKIYDSSAEFRKLSRKKSFSQNQMEMAVEYESEEDLEASRLRREELKAALLSARQNHFEAPQPEEPKVEQPQKIESYYPQKQESIQQSTPEKEEEHQDDGVFITSRIEQREIPIQRKISPANLDIAIDNSKLPAPNRNSNIEPTYKDMMSKLFEQKKEEELASKAASQTRVMETEIEPLADYASLKKYYKQHDIEFKEHIKGNTKINHNTNYLSFLSSTILLLLSGISSAILFWIVSATGNLNASSNCLFYVAPILFFAWSVILFVNWKLFPSKKSKLPLNAFSNWAIFILGLIVVLIINVIAGMQIEAMGTYLTSLLVPTITLLLFFPVNYHLTKFLFKRFGK